MKRVVPTITILVVFALFHLLIPKNTYAYLDPGTGSFIIQMLIASIVGGLFILKLYFNKIKAFFKRRFSKGESDEQADEKSKE